MEFPRLVYRSASEHIAVDSQEAYDIARKEGWFASVPEAIAKAHEVADETTPPTRAEMEAQAKTLGIKIDARWGDSRLLEAINKSMNGG